MLSMGISGTTTISTFVNGHGMSNSSEYRSIALGITPSAYSPSSSIPLTVYTRIGMRPFSYSLSVCVSRYAKSPTAHATRYVLITGVVSNLTICHPSRALATVSLTGMLFSATWSVGTSIDSAKLALRYGKSKQGNARRALSGSMCVLTM